MDVVAGALGRLPAKLLELVKEEYKLQIGVKDQIRLLSRELESMHAALREVGQVPPEQLKEQLRLWARDVREASYDMEDVLDTFLVRVQGAPAKDPAKEEKKVKRLMKKMGNLFSLSKTKARHEIADAIEAISKQLEEVAKLRDRYTVDDVVAKPAAATSIDPRLLALYPKASQLVGIDGPRDELIQMLSLADDDVSPKEVKIVSIVGIGGLGKTTLAKAVYEKLTVDIRYKAFVPVGRNPDLKKVLRDILIDLDKEHYTTRINLAILDERQLINELREFLKNKRYFIVIDDIWDASSWSTLRCVVNDNTLGSKIILTTRNRAVAEKVGHHSYNMKPLPHEISKLLFYGRIFSSEEKCPTQFSEISERILKKCGGVPLAILTTSSLLATKSRHIKQWHEVHDYIGSGDGKNSDMDNMRKILSLSYYDLPSSLKSCLLYLSTFPEDYVINKRRLILRWVAEDFVKREGDKSLFEVGEGYFNELLNRSLIQPVHIHNEGIPSACRVHDIVLDLICSLSREENFVTFTSGDNKQITPSLGSKVRRLSLHNTIWPTISMPKVRTLTIFSPPDITNGVMSSLSYCHHLRVLDLEDCNLEKHDSLQFVGKLIHLRFLGLRNTRYKGELPAEIEKLQFLQTLDILGTGIAELPSSILRLRQLMFLLIDESTRLPNLLMNLMCLEWLETAGVDSTYTAKALGHLTELRVLYVQLSEDKEGRLDDSLCKSLIKSLGNLHKIQYLSIRSDVSVNLDGSVESLASLHTLLIDKTSSLPTWINGASLPLLSKLRITVDKVRWEDIQVLGMLPALRSLQMYVNGTSIIQVEEMLAVSPDAFPCLTWCNFYGFTTAPSMFPPGAMPVLVHLGFFIQVENFSNGDFNDLAMGHLPSLRHVDVKFYSKGIVRKEMVAELEQALKHEADVHPNHPSILCDTFWVKLEEEEEREALQRKIRTLAVRLNRLNPALREYT
ncbi:hypothetical protein ACP4OV_002093 [Aristida adscensionis]